MSDPMRRLTRDTVINDRTPVVRDCVFLVASAHAEVYDVQYGDLRAIVKKAPRADGETEALIRQRQATLNGRLTALMARQRTLPGTLEVLDERLFQGSVLYVLPKGDPLVQPIPRTVDWLEVLEGIAWAYEECHTVAAFGDGGPANTIKENGRWRLNDCALEGDRPATPGYTSLRRWTAPFDPQDRASDIYSLYATAQFASLGVFPAAGKAVGEGETDPKKLQELAKQDVARLVERMRRTDHPRVQEAIDLVRPGLERGLDPVSPSGSAREARLAFRAAREVLRPEPAPVVERVEVPVAAPVVAPVVAPVKERGRAGLVLALVVGVGLGMWLGSEMVGRKAAAAAAAASAAAASKPRSAPARSWFLCMAHHKNLRVDDATLEAALRSEVWSREPQSLLTCVFALACEQKGGAWCEAEEWGRLEQGWGKLETVVGAFRDAGTPTPAVVETWKGAASWCPDGYDGAPWRTAGCSRTIDELTTRLGESWGDTPIFELEHIVAELPGQQPAFEAAKELAWHWLSGWYARTREEERVRRIERRAARHSDSLNEFGVIRWGALDDPCGPLDSGRWRYQPNDEKGCVLTNHSTLLLALDSAAHAINNWPAVVSALDTACRKGDAAACGLWADQNLTLQPTPPARAAALRRWARACDLGFSGACVTLAADAWQLGDEDECARRLGQAADLGNEQARETKFPFPPAESTEYSGFRFERTMDADSLGHLEPFLSYGFIGPRIN